MAAVTRTLQATDRRTPDATASTPANSRSKKRWSTKRTGRSLEAIFQAAAGVGTADDPADLGTVRTRAGRDRDRPRSRHGVRHGHPRDDGALPAGAGSRHPGRRGRHRRRHRLRHSRDRGREAGRADACSRSISIRSPWRARRRTRSSTACGPDRRARERSARRAQRDSETHPTGKRRSTCTPPVDLVVANILAEIILLFIDDVYAALKPGGLYIASGIYMNKEKAVEAGLEAAGFEILDVATSRKTGSRLRRGSRRGR